MARYPGAKWRPVSGHTDGPMRSYRGAVLHVNESNGNLYNWVAGDHDMSCHFEVYKDGSIEQYLDTADTSWCQMDGNPDWISIETEGFHTEALTDAQVQAIAGIMTWLNQTHHIPLRIANTAAEHGFGWHGMGGTAWGGHLDCPGDKRKAQRQQILTIAAGDDMSAADVAKIVADVQAVNQNVKALSTALAATPHDVWAYKFKGQQALGYLVTGADPAAFAAAVVAALPSSAKGGLTEADVEDAVKKVFADAAS